MTDFADTQRHGLTRYKHGPGEHGQPGGCRCAACRAANAAWQARRSRLIAYGQWDGWLDATGTRRRIQALMRNGWSMGLLAGRLGCTRQALRSKLYRGDRVTRVTAAVVRALYDELWDQAPPEGNRFERRNATMARRYAQERGWPVPLAWSDDEIDDPQAAAAEDWERRDGIRRWGVLAEDAAYLLAAGQELGIVAERLGVSQNTLRTVLARAAAKQEASGRAA